MEEPSLPDVAGPTIVHKVKSKLGYTEMHSTPPGFNEDVSYKKKRSTLGLYEQMIGGRGKSKVF